MTLSVEAFHPEYKKWVQIGILNPGDQIGSFTQHLADGREELYLFHCESDDVSRLRRAVGVDHESISPDQRVFSPGFYEEIVTLHHGEEYFLTIHPDNPNQGGLVRFKHHDPRLS